MKESVQIKRAYEAPAKDDGYRVLIDRLWPRGVTKQDLELDDWNKALAPSPPLRKWFGHKVEHWNEFRDSYRSELHTAEQKARMRGLIHAAKGRKLTLVYAAKDVEHNHALVLADELKRLY